MIEIARIVVFFVDILTGFVTLFYTHLVSLKEKGGRRVCLEMLLSCLETVWFRKEKEGCVIFMLEKLRFLPMNPAKFRFTENHQSETKNIAI